MESITGKVLRTFPQDTNTDEIISGKHKYDELDLNKLAVHTVESIDPAFYADSKCMVGQIVVAESFGRIFLRKGFKIGLPQIECAGISEKTHNDDELRINFEDGVIKNTAVGETYDFSPIPAFMQELLDAGGLLGYLEAKGRYE